MSPFVQFCPNPFRPPKCHQHLVGEVPTAIEQPLFDIDIKIAKVLQVLSNLPPTPHILSQAWNQLLNLASLAACGLGKRNEI
jgi:hypothetical protein